MKSVIPVSVGIIVNDAGEVFLAKRSTGSNQGNLWEFPGGKIDNNEDSLETLRRELFEEIGIEIKKTRPLISIKHQYPDCLIQLDAWLVKSWKGTPSGKEGQSTRWFKLTELNDIEFPEANRSIINSLTLPEFYLISPPPGDNSEAYLYALEDFVRKGTRLIQLRYDEQTIESRPYVIREVTSLCHKYGAKIMLNSTAADVIAHEVDGVHLTSSRLLQLNERPLGRHNLVSASCHNQMELSHAERIKVDFVVLSPVNKTASHPDVEPLGWDKFGELVKNCNVPVFALGGMYPDDMEKSWQYGAQGISMLSGIWTSSQPGEVINRCVTAGY